MHLTTQAAPVGSRARSLLYAAPCPKEGTSVTSTSAQRGSTHARRIGNRTGRPGHLHAGDLPPSTHHRRPSSRSRTTPRQRLIRSTVPRVESGNSQLQNAPHSYRTEVLNAHLFESVAELRALTDTWLRIYNSERPHDSLGRVPPLTFLPRPSSTGQSLFAVST